MSGRACVKFARGQGGAIGCTLGLAPHVYVGAYGASAAEALSRAGLMAAELQAVIDEHPVLSAALKLLPGGGTAFRALAAAAALYNSDATIEDVTSRVGPTAARLAKKLVSIF